MTKNITTLFAIVLCLTACGSNQSDDLLEAASSDKNLDNNQQKVCPGTVITNSSALNVRSTPEVGNNLCGQLERLTPVTVSVDAAENGFIKIRTNLCDGTFDDWAYVSEKYISVKQSCVALDDTVDEDEEERDPASLDILKDVLSYIKTKLFNVKTVRPIRRNGPKGSVNIHRVPGKGKNLMCGIKHIRDYRSESFLQKESLCAWTAVAMEWRQTKCAKNDSHCRIMQGDATFGKRQPASWPHSTHRRGWCMDVWPMRKKGCGEKEVTWKSSCYDREATKDLVNLMVKHGADRGNQLFFNDPKIPHVRPLGNHDDHIHVCFKPTNNKVKKSCSGLQVDRKLCPEFKD